MTRLGRDIKDALHRLLGVPVCVGIAPTRTLAKLANRTAKKIPVFDGVCVWPATRPEWRQRLMEVLPVSEVWGIAGRLERRLGGYGVRSIWDLVVADPVQVRKWFNVVVMRTALELRGVACIGPEEDRTGKKDQLIVSRSFSEKVTTVAGIRQALSVYAQQAAARLVKHSQVARRVDVFAGTSHWTEQKHYPSARIRLPFPTADPVELTRAAHQLLPQIQDGHRYARTGLMLTDLLPAGIHMPLEPFRNTHEDAGIAALVDGVQKKAGKDALGLGYGGFRPGPSWQMKRGMLTPARQLTGASSLASARDLVR
jgi:DNA polymerase V